MIAEAGAMNYMEQDIAFEVRMGDGSQADQGLLGKLFNTGKRTMTGESLFITHFTNRGRVKRHVAFAAPCPGKIIPLNLAGLGNDILWLQSLPFSRLADCIIAHAPRSGGSAKGEGAAGETDGG